MDTAKLLEFITIEMQLARRLLELADWGRGDAADPEAAARAIEHAGRALEAARAFMPKADLSTAERAYIESELGYLEGQVQGSRGGKEKANRKKRK